jgi:hypothetical protein
MSDTIRIVKSSLEHGETNTFKLQVYIVNFDANVDFPSKFVYIGCCRPGGAGQRCAKKLDSISQCQRHGNSLGSSSKMYRFDLYLVDSSVGPDCPPLRATIFEAASNLLGMNPTDFSQQSDYDQFLMVHSVTNCMQLIDVVISTRPGQVVVQSILTVLDDVDATPAPAQTRRAYSVTPRQNHLSTPSSYFTPQEDTRLDPTPSSGRSQGNLSQLSNLKSKLQDLIEIIDLTHI